MLSKLNLYFNHLLKESEHAPSCMYLWLSSWWAATCAFAILSCAGYGFYPNIETYLVTTPCCWDLQSCFIYGSIQIVGFSACVRSLLVEIGTTHCVMLGLR